MAKLSDRLERLELAGATVEHNLGVQRRALAILLDQLMKYFMVRKWKVFVMQ